MNERYTALTDAYLIVKSLRTYDYDASDNFIKRVQEYLQKEQQWVFESLTKPPKVDYNELARQEWLVTERATRRRLAYGLAAVTLMVYLIWATLR